MCYKSMPILFFITLLFISCDDLLLQKSCSDPNAENYVEDASQYCADADGDGKGDCCTYGYESDPAAANAKVEEANEKLFADLNDVFDAEPPDDFDDFDQYFDMTESYELYEEAVVLDTLSAGAHFGLAFTVLATLTQDQMLYDTMDDWIECIDSFNTEDINYIESEFNDLMLEDGFKDLFDFVSSKKSFHNIYFLEVLPISSKGFFFNRDEVNKSILKFNNIYACN